MAKELPERGKSKGGSAKARKQASPPNPRRQRLWRDLSLIAIAPLLLYLLACLFTYTADDPGWSQAAGSVRTHLSCHERGRLLLVPLADILYLKADLKYVAARTAEREYLLDESLTQLEEEFGERFIRLHRNALAAREAIVGFEKGPAEDGEPAWQAILRGIPERLPVSRRQWAQVRQCVKLSGL